MKMFKSAPALLVASAAVLAAACSPAAESPADTAAPAQTAAAPEPAASPLTAPPESDQPTVYFANLKDGDTVTSPFRVVFGLTGMGVAPAGTEKEMTGHHHLLIDTELTPEEMEYAIPNDEQHRHFGGGQTEMVLDLPPGQHTLQLNFGDLKHEQFDPPILSDKITITVE